MNNALFYEKLDVLFNLNLKCVSLTQELKESNEKLEKELHEIWKIYDSKKTISTVDFAQVRKLGVELVHRGRGEEIHSALAEMGYKSLDALPQDKLGEAFKRLKVIDEQSKTVDYETVKILVKELVSQGKEQEIKNVLAKTGYSKIAELSGAQLAEFYKRLIEMKKEPVLPF